MANEVRVVFIGDANQIFKTADDVDARIGRIGSLGAPTNDPFAKLTTSITNATPAVERFGDRAGAALGRAEVSVDRLTAKFEKQIQQLDPFFSRANVSLAKTAEGIDKASRGADEYTKAMSGLASDSLDTKLNAPLRETNRLLDDAVSKSRQFADEFRKADPFHTNAVQPTASEAARLVNRYVANQPFIGPKQIEGSTYVQGSELARSLTDAQHKAADLHLNLRRLSDQAIGTRGVDGLGRAAERTGLRVHEIYNRLREIEVESGRTFNARALDGLQQEARALSRELDTVTSKVQRVASGRAAAANRNASRGASVVNGLGVAASLTGNEYLNDAATLASAIPEAGLLKVTSALAGMGPALVVGAAAIAATYKITGDIRAESEKRLEIENKITAAINKQQLALANVRAEFAKNQKERALNDELSDYVQNSSPEALRRRLELLNNPRNGLVGMTADQGMLERYALEIPMIQDKLKQLAKAEAEAAKASATNLKYRDWDDWDSKQQQRIKEQEKFNESVKKATERVTDLGKTWTSAFTSLAERSGGDNPFIGFLAKAKKESDELNESIKGLPIHLQTVARSMLSVAQNKEAFTLRLDNALSVANLRFQAANFLNPSSPERDRGLESQYIARFLRDNPNFLNLERQQYNQERDVNPLTWMESFDERVRRKILDPAYAAGVIDNSRGRQNSFLQDQYNLIYDRRRAGFDQGEADKKFIALTQGLNPFEIPERLRREAADARINEAARQENFEKEARGDRKQMIKLLGDIKDVTAGAMRTAQTAGTAGVNRKLGLEVTLKNESDTRASANATTGSSDDVDARYNFTGFGLAGGTNR